MVVVAIRRIMDVKLHIPNKEHAGADASEYCGRVKCAVVVHQPVAEMNRER